MPGWATQQLQASLGYIRPCLQKEKESKTTEQSEIFTEFPFPPIQQWKNINTYNENYCTKKKKVGAEINAAVHSYLGSKDTFQDPHWVPDDTKLYIYYVFFLYTPTIKFNL
jgi:hypothetical protein